MPRCFLAKKSSLEANNVKWPSNNNGDSDEANENDSSATLPDTRNLHHRSTIGSISAAEAVRSIQEPVGLPAASTAKPASSTSAATLLPPQSSMRTLKEASTNAASSMMKQFAAEPMTSQDVKPVVKSEPVAPATCQSIPTVKKCHEKLQERRKRPLNDSQTVISNNNNNNNNLSFCDISLSPICKDKNNVKPSDTASSSVATITPVQATPLQNGRYNPLNGPMPTRSLHISIPLPPQKNQQMAPPVKQIKLEPNFRTLSPPPPPPATTRPLPPEILATMKPHPPQQTLASPTKSSSSSSSSPTSIVLPTVPVPMTSSELALRMHTKEETEAAHDLLELSRSLPPISGPNHVTVQAAPPTPPSPPDDQHYTLIYITSPTPFQNEFGTRGATSGQTPNFTGNEYPLTPPEQSTDIYNNMGSTSSYMGSPSTIHSTPPQMSSDEDEDSGSEVAASDLTLSIVDGRTKKSKHGGLNGFSSKDKSKYTCSECGKNYATSSNLSRHKQTHRSLDSGSAKKCHICGKMYVSMPALSMHILTHNLNHRCNVCGKAFSRPWLLQGHLRSHTGQKPYLCTVCKKCFADRSNLRAHMQTHSPAKNYQCGKCKKTFALKSYLNKHYESACVRGADSPDPMLHHQMDMDMDMDNTMLS